MRDRYGPPDLPTLREAGVGAVVTIPVGRTRYTYEIEKYEGHAALIKNTHTHRVSKVPATTRCRVLEEEG
jgi:hypothetical protein